MITNYNIKKQYTFKNNFVIIKFEGHVAYKKVNFSRLKTES